MNTWFFDEELGSVVYYTSSIGESWWMDDCYHIVKEAE